MTDQYNPETPASSLTSILQQAGEAARRGDSQFAHQLSLEATRIAPGNIEAWLLRLRTAPTIEDAVASLNQVNSLQPRNLEARQETYQLVQKLLKQDPQLKYLDEADDRYRVQTGEQVSLIVPKDRLPQQPVPMEQSARFRFAYLLLTLALIGLLPAGRGAIVFAPLAALIVLIVNFYPISRPDRIHSLVLMILSASLWLIGLLLGVIFLVHLI